MFRPVRRKSREISLDAARNLLKASRRGVLAVNGDNGYPYALPLNYIYDEKSNTIIFHGARAGHKLDSIKACDKVCFTVYKGRGLGSLCTEYHCLWKMSPGR